jgi:hypothetical protein
LGYNHIPVFEQIYFILQDLLVASRYCTDADENTKSKQIQAKFIYYLSRKNQGTPEEANVNNPPNDHTLQASLFLGKHTKTLISEQPQQVRQLDQYNHHWMFESRGQKTMSIATTMTTTTSKAK